MLIREALYVSDEICLPLRVRGGLLPRKIGRERGLESGDHVHCAQRINRSSEPARTGPTAAADRGHPLGGCRRPQPT